MWKITVKNILKSKSSSLCYSCSQIDWGANGRIKVCNDMFLARKWMYKMLLVFILVNPFESLMSFAEITVNILIFTNSVQ